MVLPLIPIAIAGGASLAGFGLGGMFGGAKKEIHAEKEYYAPTVSKVYAPTHAPQLQFAPVTTYGYVGPTTIIESPGARVKKEQIMDVISKPEQMGTWELPISVAQEPKHTKDIAGTNLTHIAIIAVIGVVAYGFLKGKK